MGVSKILIWSWILSISNNLVMGKKLSFLFVMFLLLIGLKSEGQAFTTLHNFGALSYWTDSEGNPRATNADGAYPIQTAMVLSNSTIYGLTTAAGAYGYGTTNEAYDGGTIFSIDVDGSGFSTLYNFNFEDDIGSYPWLTGLSISSNLLYGSTRFGGSAERGTIYSYDIGSREISPVYSMTTADDFGLIGGLAFSSDGTVVFGTLAGDAAGEIFSLQVGGAGPTTALGTWEYEWVPEPCTGPLLVGSMLYGTLPDYDDGVVYALGTNGDGPSFLHYFDGSDGDFPLAGLISDGTNLYGTTAEGGPGGWGTVFSCSMDGSQFNVIHSFDGAGGPQYGLLLLVGNTLYGTTSGANTIFQVNTDGSGFVTLYTFSALDSSGCNSDGAVPECGLTLYSNILYGTTSQGGSNGTGTIFALQVPGITLTDSSGNPTLINVQIADGGASKAGEEAVGYSDSDEWNIIGTPLYSGDEPAYGSPYFGGTNLVDYQGNVTAVNVYANSVDDSPYAVSGDPGYSSDPLFESLGDTAGGGDWYLEIDNLAPGSYNIYLFASAPSMPDDEPVTFTIDSVGSATANDDSDTAELSVTKSDYSPVIINISSRWSPICNGLQIQKTE